LGITFGLPDMWDNSTSSRATKNVTKPNIVVAGVLLPLALLAELEIQVDKP